LLNDFKFVNLINSTLLLVANIIYKNSNPFLSNIKSLKMEKDKDD